MFRYTRNKYHSSRQARATNDAFRQIPFHFAPLVRAISVGLYKFHFHNIETLFLSQPTLFKTWVLKTFLVSKTVRLTSDLDNQTLFETVE